MKKKRLYIAVLILIGLASCTNEIENYDYANQATFTGAIDGLRTRMSETSWDAGDAIGITGGDRINVQYKTEVGDGTFTPASDSKPITFDDAKPITFTAYYPYTDGDGTINVSTTLENQSDKIDYLFAKAIGSKVTPDVNFTFKHCMSQLKLNFEAGDGLDDLSGMRGFTLSRIAINGTFNTTDGSTTYDASSAADIVKPLNGITTSTYTETLILLPQSVTDNTLTLTVTVGDKEFVATMALPSSTSNQLLSGFCLNYTIKVNKSSAVVNGMSIDPWNYQDDSSTAKSKVNLVTADGAEQYALALSNGLFYNIWDTDKVNDDGTTGGIKSELLNSDGTSFDTGMVPEEVLNSVVGIVYWLGTTDENPTTNDSVLLAHHPDCTHGLIVALSDANSGNLCVWQSSYEFIYEEFQGESEYGVSTSQGYNTIELTWKTDVKKLNKILGYNNTYVLRRYNATRVKESNMSDYEVKAVTAIDNYTPSAPKGSSGWFLPSPKELVLLVNGTSSISFGNYNNYTYNSVKTNIGTILTALNSAGVSVSKTSLNNYYWSSSESASYSDSAYSVDFYSDYCGSVSYYFKDYAYNYVRAVSAF